MSEYPDERADEIEESAQKLILKCTGCGGTYNVKDAGETESHDHGPHANRLGMSKIGADLGLTFIRPNEPKRRILPRWRVPMMITIAVVGEYLAGVHGLFEIGWAMIGARSRSTSVPPSRGTSIATTASGTDKRWT